MILRRLFKDITGDRDMGNQQTCRTIVQMNLRTEVTQQAWKQLVVNRTWIHRDLRILAEKHLLPYSKKYDSAV